MASLAPIPLAQPHWECLSAQLRQMMVAVGRQPFNPRFYLVGGTALALQLGHRISIDLDFFAVDDELLAESRQEIITALKPQLEFEIIQSVVGSLLLNVGGVALGFFSYQYPLLGPPFEVEGINVANILDVGLMKLDAIASRGVNKDFYDLYFIAAQLPLESLLERSQEKYPTTRDFGVMALRAMVDFTVADRQPPLQTFPPLGWAEVRAFFLQEARRIGQSWFEE